MNLFWISGKILRVVEYSTDVEYSAEKKSMAVFDLIFEKGQYWGLGRWKDVLRPHDQIEKCKE